MDGCHDEDDFGPFMICLAAEPRVSKPLLAVLGQFVVIRKGCMRRLVLSGSLTVLRT